MCEKKIICTYFSKGCNGHFWRNSVTKNNFPRRMPESAYRFVTKKALVLLLVLKSQLSSAPKYLCDHIRPPLPAFSLRPLRSSNHGGHDCFIPPVRTPMVQVRCVYWAFSLEAGTTGTENRPGQFPKKSTLPAQPRQNKK